MKTVKLRALKDFKDGNLEYKKGKIYDVSAKHHEVYLKMGTMEKVEKKHSKQHTKDLKRAEHKIHKRKENTEQSQKKAKPILDKYAVHIVRKKAVWTNKEGQAQVDQNKGEDYDPETYDTDIVLWEPPLNWIRLEFEDTPEKNRKIINKIESNLKALNYDYCITDHGGKSPYINLVFKGIPLNNDNKLAKIQFCKSIMDDSSFSQLDRTNLGFTLSPVIGHQHWKPKYNGAIHKITKGKNPLEHDNEFPKDILKDIKKAKKTYKKSYQKLIQNDNWVKDFLINHCTTADISKWSNRHQVIEKNLAILIINHPDRDEIIQRYNKNKAPDSANVETWFPDIINGKYTECNPGELKNYINDNDIDYIIVDEQGSTSTQQEKPKKLSKIEKKEIRNILTDPSLIVDTIQEVQNNGISGEEDTILSLILVSTTRLVKGANAESKNLFLSDKTGLGKDYVTEKTLKVILPEENFFHVTKMTPESFTYWHNATNEPEWTWDDKCIQFEDITQQLLNCATFKVMASGGSHAVVVIDQETKEIPINGKPVMIPTSHHANPGDEALRRFPIGGLDDTIKQTQRIKSNIAKRYSGKIDKTANTWLRRALHELRPFEVVIPYAEIIQYFFPDHTLMRTHFKRFLDYICASAVFHQGQRKLTKSGKLIATPDDYMIARIVLIYTSAFERMTPISKERRDVVKIIKENIAPMTISNILSHPDYNFSKKWLYRHLPKLAEMKLLKKTMIRSEEANKDVIAYYYADINAEGLPTWQEIIKFAKQLDGVKTDNTDKTKNELLEENPLKKWLCHPMTKHVLTPLTKPTNREVVTVFPVLSNYLRKANEKKYLKYFATKEEMALPEKPKDQQTTIEETDKKTKEINPKSDESKNEPEKKADSDEKKKYHRKLKDFLSKHPKTKFDLDKIGVAVGLSGPKGKGLIKEIMNEDIIKNGEHSFFMKHDDQGYYWSTRRA